MKKIAALALALALAFGGPAWANEMSNSTWSEVDANNNAPAPNGWTPGVMLPSQVEPTAQAMMGALKRWWNRDNATVTATYNGSSGVFTYTPANGAFPTSYVNGETYTFQTTSATTTPSFLNVAGLGNKTLYKSSPSGMVQIGSGDIAANQVVRAVYSTALGGFYSGGSSTSSLLASNNTWTGTNLFNNTVTFQDGSAWSSGGISLTGSLLFKPSGSESFRVLGSGNGVALTNIGEFYGINFTSGSTSTNGQAFFQSATSTGAYLQGKGSSYDVTLGNSAGAVALGISTGTTNIRIFGNTNIVGQAATGTELISLSGTTTGYQQIVARNTSGVFALSIEGSAGGQTVVGAPAYAATLAGQVGLGFSGNGGANLHAFISQSGLMTMATNDNSTHNFIETTNNSTGNSALSGFKTNNTSTYGAVWQTSTGYSNGAGLPADATFFYGTGTGGVMLGTGSSSQILFDIANSIVAQFTSSGNFGVGVAPGGTRFVAQGASTQTVLSIQNSGTTALFYSGVASQSISSGENGTNTMLFVRKDTTSGRSINAAGTINASGADYAENEALANVSEIPLAGDVIGYDVNGKVTKHWSAAITFGIVSTAPSLVGGDSWGDEAHVGAKPNPPVRSDGETDDAWVADQAAYTSALATWNTNLAAAQAAHVITAYSGKVPVNVADSSGFAVGDFVVPAASGDSIIVRDVPRASVTATPLGAVGIVRKILSLSQIQVDVIH